MFGRAQKPQAEGPVSFTDEDKAKARTWFARAKDLAEKKNYDYAIECYINGLDFWPEAVEDAHMPCRAAALFRGPKKIGFGDSMKYKTGGKDYKKSMLNAEMLLSKEPKNVGHMETMFKSAVKGHFDKTAMWIGEIFADAAAHEEKPSASRFELLRDLYDEIADRYTVDEPKVAITALERAVDALSRLQTLKPQDMEVSTAIRNVAGKLTILKGGYGTVDSFRESVSDTEAQREMHDRERVVQSEERLGELIASSEAAYKADPTNANAIRPLVDLLCRREDDADETKAIGILVTAYKATNEYRYKSQAEDIRIKQLNRRTRQAKASGDREAYKKQRHEQLRFELNAYKDRARQYPSDLRLRYQYGRLLFDAGRYDDAIPVLQEARSDPKSRTSCSLYIGRCFYEKAYYGQAINIIKEAIASYEMPEDDVGKRMHYWLGRAYEGNGDKADALKVYGQLIEWDYNYGDGDVRRRMDGLK
jgi:tetratricopeptide (TPR) repeat protein